MHPPIESKDVTACISNVGNREGLLLCLSALLNAYDVPGKINLSLQGEFVGINSFYMEQLFDLARHRKVTVQITVDKKEGVRKSRQRHLSCGDKWLWFIDDDVIVAPNCLSYMLMAHKELSACPTFFGYICGTKPDINNRRGYGDFSSKVHPASQVKDFDSFNQFYETDAKPERLTYRVNTCDTGNVLINAQEVNRAAKNLGHKPFDLFGESYNCGGEDTLFGLWCNHYDLLGYFTPYARAIHLEKEKVNFGEFAARGEMLLHACAKLGFDPTPVKKEFMPFLKRQ